MYTYNRKETVEIPWVRNNESAPAEFDIHQRERERKKDRQRKMEK